MRTSFVIQFIVTLLLCLISRCMQAQHVGIHTIDPQHPLQVNVDSAYIETTLDQHCVSHNGFLSILPGQSAGQSLVAGMDGEISEIHLLLSGDMGMVQLSVYSGSAPGGALLVQQQLLVGSVEIHEYAFVFEDLLPAVQAGDDLFIALTHLSGGNVFWRKHNANPYAGGSAFLNTGSWAPQSGDDMVFLVFVDIPATASVPVLTVRESGRVGIKNYMMPETDGASGEIMITDGNGDVHWIHPTQIPGADVIHDLDGDTRIETEKNPDEDVIRIDISGIERVRMLTNENGVPRLELFDDGNNVVLGASAGASLQPVGVFAGGQNVLVGVKSGLNSVNGYRNTAVGYETLRENLSGFYNTAIGSHVLTTNTQGAYNTAVGVEALKNNTQGSSNVAIGYHTLFQNTTGDYHTAIGHNALSANTTGTINTAVGRSSLSNNTSGSYNTGLGADALRYNTAGSNNVAVGLSAMVNNTSASDGTAVGSEALRNNTTGYRNTAIGRTALRNNTIGSINTAAGFEALKNNLDGHGNAAFGAYTMRTLNSGSGNSAFGSFALELLEEGGMNTAVGRSTLKSNVNGFANTATGAEALYSTTGNYNTGIGYQAIDDNTTGSYRTGIGYHSNGTGTNYDNTTGLGYAAFCTAPNQVRVGNGSVTSIGGYANWSNLSDSRFKQNVLEDVPGMAFINSLRPVTYTIDLDAIDAFFTDHYNYNDSTRQINREKETIRYSGFLAQDVEAAAQAINYEFSGVDAPKNASDFYGLRYAEFVVPLVKAVQELSTQNVELLQRLDVMQAEIDALKTE